MSKRQESFEDQIILESELPAYYNQKGEPFYMTIDTLPCGYLTLSDVVSEYGRDLDFETRKMLQVIVNERMSHLNTLQREIAELRYIDNKTIREIRDIVNKSISTVHYHITKINHVIRSI